MLIEKKETKTIATSKQTPTTTQTTGKLNPSQCRAQPHLKQIKTCQLTMKLKKLK